MSGIDKEVIKKVKESTEKKLSIEIEKAEDIKQRIKTVELSISDIYKELNEKIYSAGQYESFSNAIINFNKIKEELKQDLDYTNIDIETLKYSIYEMECALNGEVIHNDRIEEKVEIKKKPLNVLYTCIYLTVAMIIISSILIVVGIHNGFKILLTVGVTTAATSPIFLIISLLYSSFVIKNNKKDGNDNNIN